MTSKHSSTQRLLGTGLFDNLTAFTEIESRISALPSNKERGDAFEIFAEAYFTTQKITQAQEVWPFEAVPLAQRQALSLDTGRDMGVDGTYLTVDGELRAYQVKFRSRRTALTWDELSTFMGLTDQVSQRVLFTNCETLPSLMQDRSGFVPIRGSDLDRLTAEDFEAMRQWLQTGQVKLARKQPLPHQQEALTAIAAGLQAHDRATTVMACGTGKSLVSLWAAEQYNCKTMLVLVPSLALVRQLLHEWLRETAWEQLTFMCVCSDPTVAKGADDLIVHQADLDFPVTTDSAVVSRFMNKPFDGVKIVFSTYQSAHVVAAGLPLDADGKAQAFDLAIFDEAHKTASREGSRFSFALEDANLPIRKRLFFTATPRHYDIRKKDKEGDAVLAYSMDRPEVYGPVIHTLSFAEAARRGIICDYKVVISVVTSEMVNDDLLKHGEVLVAGDIVKARQVALQIALQKAVEKYGVSRIFTFHGSVAAARSFTSSDSDGIQQHLPDFTTLHVSGEMPTSRREDQMKAFRQADKAVISNARCLTEGVDVPAVDMVAFISPRKSKVDIVQATGRAMRKSPGKEFGYVMVPLFVEQASNESIEEALHRTGFDDVWDLLGAMREQDDVLVDIIRQMQEDKGRTGGYNDRRLSERVEVLGPSVSLETIRESITAECLESLGVSWDERFGEMLAYKNVHGHTNVSAAARTVLGSWISNQRTYFKSGKLQPDRVAKLQDIDFVWDALDEQWVERFNELVAYGQEHGNLDVPQRWTGGLGAWVNNQRQLEKSGELSPDRKIRLIAVGFIWDPLEWNWHEQFRLLCRYQTEHNSEGTDSWPKDLNGWISSQRMRRDGGVLSSEKVALLESIGFVWRLRDAAWQEKVEELRIYIEKHGNADVPQREPSGLGAWLNTRRKEEKSGNLAPERKAALEKLGIQWNPVGDKWGVMYEQLLAYQKEHGTANVSINGTSDLDAWVGRQRKARKNGALSDDRVRLLDKVGFDWDPFATQWDVMFKELLAYRTEHNSVSVPQRPRTALGRWVRVQRESLKNGRLTSEHRERLDEVGFVWDVRTNQCVNVAGVENE